MRILDQKRIDYKSYSYADTDAISGMEVATILNQNPNQVLALPNATQEFGTKKMLEDAGNGFWN